MHYRIEVAEYLSGEWLKIAVIEKSFDELESYLCVIKRMHPGSQVRALDAETSEVLIQV